MLKKTVLIALMALSSIVATPQLSSAEPDDPNAPPCDTGCTFIWTYDDNGTPIGGHWECHGPQADCVGGF